MKVSQSYQTALTGLLRDIGNLAFRADELTHLSDDNRVRLIEEHEVIRALIPPEWLAGLKPGIRTHPEEEAPSPTALAVCIADWLSAPGRPDRRPASSNTVNTPLVPVTANLSLEGNSEGASTSPAKRWGYPLDKWQMGHVLFPEQGVTVNREEYRRLWDALIHALDGFPGPVDSYARMAAFLDILKQTTCYAPFTTFRPTDEDSAASDISLYNHLRLTAAIAVCLGQLDQDVLGTLYQAGREGLSDQEVVVARLLKVDFSGIQAFIYRITEPADERRFQNTAKRLRGRSLYLALLNQAIGNWLVRELNLPPTNVLYAGGGVIELLIPPDDTTTARLETAMQAFSDGMWQTFSGDLGFVYASEPMAPGDFADVSSIRSQLEAHVGRAKNRKWYERLAEDDFFNRREIVHTCTVCGLTPVNAGGTICSLCDRQRAMGQQLPYSVSLAHSFEPLPEDLGVSLEVPPPMEGFLKLLDDEDQASLIDWAQHNKHDVLVKGINQLPVTSRTWPGGIARGRWPVANAAPIADNKLYDFDAVADLSRGAPLLGVLRADVDRMGLNFSHGLHPPTFARSATLSETVARFFGPYLNTLTKDLTDRWHGALDEDEKMQKTLQRREVTYTTLKNLFYVLYAGGDDLFVVGPWDQMVTFALELAERFQAYTCGTLTLSGGLIFVKPHFPVQQFARLAGEAEHAAKAAGRNRFQIFDRTLTWTRAKALIALAQDWVARDVPRGLIHDLGQMGRSYAVTKEGEKPLFTPRLHYTMIRRLQGWNAQDRERLTRQVFTALKNHDIIVPVSYASLSTRRE
jgi:CRISPR-associated protein Csm1